MTEGDKLKKQNEFFIRKKAFKIWSKWFIEKFYKEVEETLRKT